MTGERNCEDIEQRLDALIAKGTIVYDRRQVFIGSDVILQNILPGAQLFPGTRIIGSRCVLGRNTVVGSEGPATLDNAVLDDNAEIASGYVTNSALLRGSRIGSNGHVRACTLLEEEASTAHAVGLKQTILMSYVTLGSLINFCDGIISGGRSRSDHTEVGSGFINFNFTPWGASGDKATPTLIGGVYKGVFLNNDRIFLGGLSGIVGPGRVSFGAFTVAGQVVRRDVKENSMFLSTGRDVDLPVNFHDRLFSERKYQHNRKFIENLFALREWYAQVRLARTPTDPDRQYKRTILLFAIELIDRMIAERLSRLNDYLKNFARGTPAPHFNTLPCPVAIAPSSEDHIVWLRSLGTADIASLEAWLREVGRSVWNDDA